VFKPVVIALREVPCGGELSSRWGEALVKEVVAIVAHILLVERAPAKGASGAIADLPPPPSRCAPPRHLTELAELADQATSRFPPTPVNTGALMAYFSSKTGAVLGSWRHPHAIAAWYRAGSLGLTR
jgi:hypothetical protein